MHTVVIIKMIFGIASVRAYLNVLKPFCLFIAAWMCAPGNIKYIFQKDLYKLLLFFHVFEHLKFFFYLLMHTVCLIINVFLSFQVLSILAEAL